MSSAVLIICFLLAGIPSRYTSVNVDIDWNGTERETTVSYRAVAGDDGRFLRVTRDFDPDYMEVELESCSYGFPGFERRIPAWAVDTLTGGEGWPRALVAAFPGLRPGMSLEWTFTIRDRGYLAGEGLFYTYIADDEPDTINVTCGSIPNLYVSSEGFVESRSHGRRRFSSVDQEYRELWLSTASDWGEVEDILLNSSRESALETPPDLREASIQAGAAGALPRMRISRGRVLITESMQLLSFPGGDAGFRVRSLQEILDTRRATPLEAATLLSAMCRVMGIDAPVVLATDILPPIPSAIGFFRVFILADGTIEEPSEYLSPSGWVDTPDTLWLLLPGGMIAELPPEAESEKCVETWSISPDDGTFSLRVLTGGGFDRELRRKLAGTEPGRMLTAVSEWFRSSGIYFYPESVAVSDLFDLTQPASMNVIGVIPPAGDIWVEAAPSLNWNRSGTISREYENVQYRNGLISR